MISLLLVSQVPPDAAWLGELGARLAGMEVGDPAPADDDLLAMLGRLRGASARTNEWLQRAAWQVEIHLDATDERLDLLQDEVTQTAIASGLAVANLRDRVITFPTDAGDAREDAEDPGPIWEHLPIGDPAIPRANA